LSTWIIKSPRGARQSGGALLAVLWLSAALGAIAFTVAGTVRGEVDRASTASDDTRAYFLASGAIQRATLWILWGRWNSGAYYQPGIPLNYQFPGGNVKVEVIPESSKLNINFAPPAEIFRLLTALSVPADRAQALTEAIIDWRSAAPGNEPTPFDMFYLQQTPSFVATHASFIEVEDLLAVRGMTPELFYGTWDRDESVQPARLVQRLGLRDCISTYSSGSLDVNTTPLPVLLAVGFPPDVAAAIVEQRMQHPFTSGAMVRAFAANVGPLGGRLMIGGMSMFTIRATAQPRTANGSLSDLKRSVSALIKFMPPESGVLLNIVRWYDRG